MSMTRRPLGTPVTPRQREVVQALYDFALQGVSPTYRELCTVLDIRSANGLRAHLSSLEAKGVLSFSCGPGEKLSARCVRLLGLRVSVSIDDTEAGERLRGVLDGSAVSAPLQRRPRLTSDDIRAMRRRYASGEGPSAIGRDYGLPIDRVQLIVTGRVFKNVV